MRKQKTNMNSSQQGAVLFVGLILLIVVTLMGVVAMKSSILQEKLAAGAMDQNIAFQAAESALRDAEIYINSSVTAASGFSAACTSGLCLPSTTSTSVWDAITDWSSSTLPINFGAQTSAPAIPDVARQPKYIIELLPDIPPAAGTGLRPPGADATDGTAFRITAMGWGKRSTTPVMLQSVYVKI